MWHHVSFPLQFEVKEMKEFPTFVYAADTLKKKEYFWTFSVEGNLPVMKVSMKALHVIFSNQRSFCKCFCCTYRL